jgi:heme A synthase
MSVEAVRLVFFHRLLALALGATLAFLAVWAWRNRAASSLTASLSVLAFGVYVLQALVGASNIWTEVADWAQIAHLAVGTALWGLLAYLNIRLFAVPELLEATGRTRVAATGLAGAAR